MPSPPITVSNAYRRRAAAGIGLMPEARERIAARAPAGHSSLMCEGYAEPSRALATPPSAV